VPPIVDLPAEIAIATRNRHKIDEILAICADWPVAWRTYDPQRSDWPEVDETGQTYLDNALLKARAIALFTGIAALADDSGVDVDALGGGPGPRSARFAGAGATDAENLTKLLNALRDIAPERRTARYRCIAALAMPEGEVVWAEGVCEGVIVDPPRGDGGFGYDPAFVPVGPDSPDGSARTMAELSAEEKHAISHRGRAFRLLRSKLFEAPAGRRAAAAHPPHERPPASP
jgi:XTP/dITP diphosphohydrolase